jgi:hypothetical protein
MNDKVRVAVILTEIRTEDKSGELQLRQSVQCDSLNTY